MINASKVIKRETHTDRHTDMTS